MSDAQFDPAAPFVRTRDDHKTEVLEDYVEMIQALTDETGEARAADLAARIGVSAATVNNTVGRLQKEGLVISEPYRSIFLTDKGKALAEACRQRHDTVEKFLISIGVSLETARLDAEGIEHHCSIETLQAMKRALG